VSDTNQAVIEEFRANGGAVPMFPGVNIVLVHHRGRLTGIERVTPVTAQFTGQDIVVFATHAGSATNPAWYENLVANPETSVEVGTETVPVRARVTEGAERERLWEQQKQATPVFAEYEAKTSRQIPVVVLERRPLA
jgi:deazaflavin-dependent oxidoreductase (nitroreductase family)